MLIEVIICAIAVLIFVAGLVATPLFLMHKRGRALSCVKVAQQGMLLCVPWILHSPCALTYYRGAQLLGRIPRFHYDSPFLLESNPFFEAIWTNTTAISLLHTLVTEHFFAVLAFIVLAPAVIVYMVPQSASARWREYIVTTFLLVANWTYICRVSPSYDWWWG